MPKEHSTPRGHGSPLACTPGRPGGKSGGEAWHWQEGQARPSVVARPERAGADVDKAGEVHSVELRVWEGQECAQHFDCKEFRVCAHGRGSVGQDRGAHVPQGSAHNACQGITGQDPPMTQRYCKLVLQKDTWKERVLTGRMQRLPRCGRPEQAGRHSLKERLEHGVLYPCR